MSVESVAVVWQRRHRHQPLLLLLLDGSLGASNDQRRPWPSTRRLCIAGYYIACSSIRIRRFVCTVCLHLFWGSEAERCVQGCESKPVPRYGHSVTAMPPCLVADHVAVWLETFGSSLTGTAGSEASRHGGGALKPLEQPRGPLGRACLAGGGRSRQRKPNEGRRRQRLRHRRRSPPASASLPPRRSHVVL